jgi:hypothetical protein
MDNLLAPLSFTFSDAQKFAQRNVCACRSHLVIHELGAGYQVECPEHGAIMAHNWQPKFVAEQGASDDVVSARELQPDRPRRSAEEIIGELGY